MSIRIANLKDGDATLINKFLSQYVISEENPNGLFAAVTTASDVVSGSTVSVTTATIYTDPEDHTSATVPFLKIAQLDGTTGVYVCGFYGSSNTASYVIYCLSYGGSGAPYGATAANKIKYAYGCDNGFLINILLGTYDTTSYECTVMVTRGNDGYPYLIMPTGTTYCCYQAYQNTMSINVLHYPDASYITYNLTARDCEQAVLCPFSGYGNSAEAASYAPYGFWIPEGPAGLRNAGFCVMGHLGETYITNGFWAIKDGGETDD